MPKGIGADGLGFISYPFSRFSGYPEAAGVASSIGAKRQTHRIFVI